MFYRTVTFQIAGKKIGEDLVLTKDDALSILNGSFFYAFKPKPTDDGGQHA